MITTRPNPYLFSCLHCGRIRCSVCEILDTRLRRSTGCAVAALRLRMDRHLARYHAGDDRWVDL